MPMRLDLHNHTAPACPNSLFDKLRRTTPQPSGEFYLKELQNHELDGLAITNFHDVEIALTLAKQYPQYIIPGAEYRVMLGESATAHIVVLGIDRRMHEVLMDARLRGISYFSGLLKQNCLPYFLAHVGWGIDAKHPRSPQLLERLIKHCIAIEVVNTYEGQDCLFAAALARYYNLAPIGGSSRLLTRTGKRAYTQSPVSTIDEFFQAIYQKNVTVASESNPGKRKPGNDYFRKMRKLWHSELGWHREAIKKLGETFIFSLVEDLPNRYHLRQRRLYRKKVLRLKQRFVEYLELRETERVFSLDVSLPKQKQLWQEAMKDIYSCFRE